MTTLSTPWRIELFGRLRVSRDERVFERFPTQRTASLLAYLAYHASRSHTREFLADMFWPGADIQSGRHSLRQAIVFLRSALEPPESPRGAVLITGRETVRLNPAAVSTDVLAFAAAIRNASSAEDEPGRFAWLTTAIDTYSGELLPDNYDDWALRERHRLAEIYRKALRQAAGICFKRGDCEQALEFARREIAADPSLAEGHIHLIALLAASGREVESGRAYGAFEKQHEESTGQPVTAAVRGRVDEAIQRLSIIRPSPRCVPGDAELTAVPAQRAPTLPAPISRFIGRDAELARIQGHLSDSVTGRMITLTGPGGTGKTRLSIEAARKAADDFSGQAWFTPLAEISESARLPGEILKAMGLAPVGGIQAEDQIATTLGDRPALLVLDNLEQLDERAAPVIQKLLERSPHLFCLATSRRRLGIMGENEIPVLPLPVPRMPGTPERLLEFSGFQLLVDRARQVRPGFEVTDRNADILAQLCVRLEGIPLAIELAAARIQSLTPNQLLAQLEDRLSFLVSRRPNANPRHQALKATIQWSVDLLPESARQFYYRLSVFNGGCTVEAAGSVCLAPDALELMELLRENSVVGSEESGDVMRFRMLETLREFGRANVGSEEWDSLRRRHAEYFCDLCERSAEEIRGTDPRGALDRLELEMENIRAALQWGIAAPDSGLAPRISAAVWPLWNIRGHLTEGRRWITAVLTPGVQDPRLNSELLQGLGWLQWGQGDNREARSAFEQAQTLSLQSGDVSTAAACLIGRSIVARDQSDYPAAKAFAREALASYRKQRNCRGEGRALFALGSALYVAGDTIAAQSLFEESLALFRSVNDRRGIPLLLSNLGTTYLRSGEVETAARLHRESLALRNEAGDRVGLPYAITDLGSVAQSRGDYPEAERLYEQSFAIRNDLGDRLGMARSLSKLAELHAAMGIRDRAIHEFRDATKTAYESGDQGLLAECMLGLARLIAKDCPEDAARLVGSAQRVWESVGARLAVEDSRARDALILELRDRLGADQVNSILAIDEPISVDNIMHQVAQADS